MSNNKPIGFFDSGLGGLSVWKEVNKLLPFENTIYLADSINAPYGIKSKEEITRLSKKNIEFLINQGCKLIVVACNTATTSSIKYLRDHFDIPIIGIEPAIKPAAMKSLTKRVAVFATEGTLVSDLFLQTSNTYAKDVITISQKGTGIVELIEAGKLHSPKMKLLLKKYITPMIDQEIDYLVLGCTHYPFLIVQLKEILPSYVEILDSGEAIARRVKQVGQEFEILNEVPDNEEVRMHVQHAFYTNKSAEIMQDFMDLVEMQGTATFKEF